jgi:hypothetical protein
MGLVQEVIGKAQEVIGIAVGYIRQAASRLLTTASEKADGLSFEEMSRRLVDGALRALRGEEVSTSGAATNPLTTAKPPLQLAQEMVDSYTFDKETGVSTFTVPAGVTEPDAIQRRCVGNQLRWELNPDREESSSGGSYIVDLNYFSTDSIELKTTEVEKVTHIILDQEFNTEKIIEPVKKNLYRRLGVLNLVVSKDFPSEFKNLVQLTLKQVSGIIDVSHLPEGLQILHIENCESLKSVRIDCDSLVFVNLSGCSNLETVSVTNCKKVVVFNLSGCNKLRQSDLIKLENSFREHKHPNALYLPDFSPKPMG